MKWLVSGNVLLILLQIGNTHCLVGHNPLLTIAEWILILCFVQSKSSQSLYSIYTFFAMYRVYPQKFAVGK